MEKSIIGNVFKTIAHQSAKNIGQEVLKLSYKKKLNAALHLENKAFQHLHITDINGIKTKKSGIVVLNKHIDFLNCYGKKILIFVDDLGGFDHKDVYNSDILSFLVHPIPEAFGRDIVMEQVEEDLVKRCSSYCSNS